MYEDNSAVIPVANKEINHANRAGAPRNDYEASMEQANDESKKVVAPVVQDLHIRGYDSDEVFESEHYQPSVIQYVPSEGYVQLDSEIGVRFMP